MAFDHSPVENPYATPNLASESTEQFSGFGPRKMPIHVLEIFSRAWNLVSGQYWMLLLIIFVGIVIGSLVPMNLLLGAMVVGIYLCLMEVERGEKVEFQTLFRGFDQFVDSLIVMILITALSFLIILPITLLFLGVAFANLPVAEDQPPGIGFFLGVFGILPFAMAAGFLIYLPFLFTFQLIADRKMGALDSIKLSCRAVWMNLGGILLFFLVLGFLSLALAMMCYLPAILFAPISTAAVWILYRDIFPEPVIEARLI